MIVNKNDHLFLHRVSASCERQIQPAPQSSPAPRSTPAPSFSATPSPPDFLPDPLTLRSHAHMLCMRASHDENSAKTN